MSMHVSCLSTLLQLLEAVLEMNTAQEQDSHQSKIQVISHQLFNNCNYPAHNKVIVFFYLSVIVCMKIARSQELGIKGSDKHRPQLQYYKYYAGYCRLQLTWNMGESKTLHASITTTTQVL